MSKTKIIIFSIIGAVIAIIAIFGSGYNSLVRSDNQVKAAWSQVDNVMQRRADLIPNLQNSVKGSMNQESKIFGQIAEARTQYNKAASGKEKLEANDELTDKTNMLINVIHENYPTLESSNNVKSLMTQLEGSENRISTERRHYIQAVQDYNNKVSQFPSVIFASMFGFDKKPEYKAPEKAQIVPEVNFND